MEILNKASFLIQCDCPHANYKQRTACVYFKARGSDLDALVKSNFNLAMEKTLKSVIFWNNHKFE